MSKARDWPGGWQMPGPRSCPGGGGGEAQVELNDALTEVTCKKHYT